MSSQWAGTTLSQDEALALMIDSNHLKHQYDISGQLGNKCVKNMYPAYYTVIDAKI